MRAVIPVLVLILVLAGLLGYRLNSEREQLTGPSGGSGEIEATAVDLSSRVGARVVRLEVKEGQTVKKGDLLLALDCSEPEAMLAEAKAHVAATVAQAEAAGANILATRRSRAAALASKEALEAQAEALEAQKESAERQAARLESIPEDVPAAAIDQSRTSALGLSHQATAARAQAKASSAQVQAVTGQIGALSAQAEAAKAQVAAADAGVTRAQLLVDECTVHAPRDAEVAEIPVEVGELTQPGRTLIRLIDTQELFATFYLPNAEVGGVEPGAPAIVVADAWPDQTIEARVRTVALEAEFTPRNIQTRTDRDRLVYPVEVVFENPENKLRSGMPVQVTLPGTERQP